MLVFIHDAIFSFVSAICFLSCHDSWQRDLPRTWKNFQTGCSRRWDLLMWSHHQPVFSCWAWQWQVSGLFLPFAAGLRNTACLPPEAQTFWSKQCMPTYPTWIRNKPSLINFLFWQTLNKPQKTADLGAQILMNLRSALRSAIIMWGWMGLRSSFTPILKPVFITLYLINYERPFKERLHHDVMRTLKSITFR